ncbi:MAG: class IV adenylate cyclase [Patescibacteria group bacterium]|nr:class IV adenylate cyclase [Patescibacteria group bacterium]
MKHINVEIKAKCQNPEAIRQILKEQKADFKGLDHQIDTYFKVSNGRLKLREGNIENYLIFYARNNQKGPKEANVALYKIDPKLNLKEILEKSLGTLVTVGKRREIYFIENIKFYIDKVKELGSFMEIEAQSKDGLISREKLLAQCQSYMKLLGINEKDLISESYSDLLLNKK